MFSVKELIYNAVNEGFNLNTIINVLSDGIDDECSKIEVYEKLYNEIYKHSLSDEFCIKLVESLSNEHEKGKKWTLDQTNEIARKIGITFDSECYSEYEFWAAMHREYYIHSESLKESGISDPMIFGKFADDYLDSNKGILKALFFYIEKQKEN